ncbi:AAA domain-containing protein [Butyricicoccus faecihominis]|uniref:AAA domain-containing protein n=1 Tax=Butyricicoccus faecihominis TaxID=1712515 RepID=UPI002479EA76|nr:AAA domain-containing protein [Butyricicoccus faecihominis]MCQ5128315.1 AAA domain-containing protein [Butyricicoccus faecihominis]
MNLKEIMVLVDGQDKTHEVRVIQHDAKSNKMLISYFKGEKVYPYSCSRVQKLENPKVIELNECVAFVDGMPVFEPQAILDFGARIRIIGYRGIAETVLPSAFCLVENSACNNDAASILNYLKDISQYTSKAKEENAFLKREMDKLTFVHPESVLSCYLNRLPIQERTPEMDGVIFPFRFNLSQKKALENALAHSVSVIEGPPGTGKTQTILNIIANLIAVQKKSVGVVSNNNEAVKNVIEKLSKGGYGFLTAMLGKSENQDAFFADMPASQVKEWDCEEEKKALMEQLASMNVKLDHLLQADRKRAQLKQELLGWRLEQEHFEIYYDRQAVEEIAKLPLLKANPDQIISFLAETTLAQERQQSDKIFYKLKLLIKYGIWNQKVLRQHETSVLLGLQKAFYKKQISKLEKEIIDYNHQLEGACFEDLLKDHQQLSEKFFRKCLNESHGKMAAPNFSKKNFKFRFQEFIKTFPIILSTTHALRLSIPQNYLLDYVIIDEASQVDLITGVLALSCCRNVIIVGDTKQLPQITNDKIKTKLKTEAATPIYDYFAHSILSSAINLYGDQLPREILREHYRCHPRIIEFCNQKYYDGELIPFTETSLSEHPLVLYRTVEGNHMRQVTQGNQKGIYNQRELDVIIQEVLTAPEFAMDQGSIGIVTPYRKQADEAGRIISGGVQSDTVHKYQGREKDTMIMSTVLSGTRGEYSLNFVDDPQMINVAVSRAIRQFILVTDHDLFYKKGKDIGDLIRYIQYSTLDENVIESQVVSIFDLLYQKYSSKLLRLKAKMKSSAPYQSEEALRVLLEDILSKEEFHRFSYTQQVLLRNLLHDTGLLTPDELRYVNNRASLDFVVFYKQDKTCVLVIEVDGFAFHENKPDQFIRDELKDNILKKYGIRVLRLPTNGSGEDEKIRNALRDCIA